MWSGFWSEYVMFPCSVLPRFLISDHISDLLNDRRMIYIFSIWWNVMAGKIITPLKNQASKLRKFHISGFLSFIITESSLDLRVSSVINFFFFTIWKTGSLATVLDSPSSLSTSANEIGLYHTTINKIKRICFFLTHPFSPPNCVFIKNYLFIQSIYKLQKLIFVSVEFSLYFFLVFFTFSLWIFSTVKTKQMIYFPSYPGSSYSYIS